MRTVMRHMFAEQRVLTPRNFIPSIVELRQRSGDSTQTG